MPFFSRLFGKSTPAANAPEPLLYKDFRIFPQPMKEGGTYRVAVQIEKDFGAETKVHQLIRADTNAALDEATKTSIAKAKQAIDQLGDALFG
ncbi:MAG: HlyU family transcriptional regulator [Cypionkella sp.]